MPAGLSVCVFLVVLCSSSTGLALSAHLGDEDQRPRSEEAHLQADTHTLGESHLRYSRSAPQLKALPVSQEDGDSQANLGELLARLLSSRKAGSVRRNSSADSRGAGPSGANHRIADRDYMGWMDFGRRSAEEYEYPS
ncbi:cholecystokinin isoform X1 [Phyllopteryx taeniolatus]|uniref:cholecystokinin isoform X1 n=1 Tax=Phyllopteryx taeniolatus TaxID=161469 RepID=UPI002AD4633B|nr:cholecystokinin isoform X1 [Phyllopteryx taeniolatus]